MRGSRVRALRAQWTRTLKTAPTETMMKQIKRAYNRRSARLSSVPFNEEVECARASRQKTRKRKSLMNTRELQRITREEYERQEKLQDQADLLRKEREL